MMGTFVVAVVLCVVCSVMVSSAAVLLKPMQERNAALEKKRNILLAAGISAQGADAIEKQFGEKITVQLVDLASGDYIPAALGLDPLTYDQRRAARDGDLSLEIEDREDIAGIQRRANIAPVYLMYEEDQLQKVILPVHGKGLWSTMYGFMALEADLNTVAGFSFYEHAETPGLGGEVDNPNWKKLWLGKQVFNDDGEVAVRVIKGSVQPEEVGAEYKVDGIAGSTITGDGVTNLLHFWLGGSGFGTYLKKLKLQQT
jgi:Na+-transporting NADH:ubiquinone oxidoreductase subunit C